MLERLPARFLQPLLKGYAEFFAVRAHHRCALRPGERRIVVAQKAGAPELLQLGQCVGVRNHERLLPARRRKEDLQGTGALC